MIPTATIDACGCGPAAAAATAARVELREEEEEHGQIFGKFQIVEKLGEGTYGKVYKAINTETREYFALKKIRIVYEDEGVPGTAIREVSLLKECEHPNVIRLYEVFSNQHALYLVFEFLNMDLRVFLKKHGRFIDPSMLRNASVQCVRGVEYCHSHRVLHRDLKPQNVLIDVIKFRLTLADFGLARTFSVPLKAYTHEVVTLWYRAPEILLGQKKYASPIDIWSLGCLIAEMATAQALFPGDSEIDTIFKIFRVLGTPTEEVWPGLLQLQNFKQTFPQWPDTHFEEVCKAGPGLGSEGIDILGLCLRFNPVERPSAARLLRHAFFEVVESPLPELQGQRLNLARHAWQ